MFPVSGLLFAAALSGNLNQQSAPIFQPGAPGAPARVITQAEAVNLGRTTFIAADVAFMQHMIVHHGQAVEMVELLQTRASNQAVRRLGQRIASSQAAEIDLMRDWLNSRGQPLEMPGMAGMHAGHDMGDHAMMAGMLTPNQMAALAAATGPAFDRLFLEGMIRHHKGALDMVDQLNANPDAAEDPMLSDFATSVVADQSAEILRMQSILSEL